MRELDGSVPGAWPNDVAFASAVALGPVAIVPRASGGSILAVAVTPSGATGQLYTVDRIVSGATTRSIPFPSPITAGPVATESVPDRVLVGLEDGRVCEYRTDTEAVRDLFDTGASAVTGIALDGSLVAAAGRSGTLVLGVFSGDQAGAGFSSITKSAELPQERNLQPLLLRRDATGTQVVVVDRTRGSARTFAFMADAPSLNEPWQGTELGEAVGPPAVADLDADGQPEIAFTTASGRVGYWNLNGSTSPGWPPELEREGFASAAGPLPFTNAVLSADPLLFALLGNGVGVALDRAAKNVEGFPLGFSVGARGTPALGPGIDGPVLYAAGGDTLLYGIRLGAPPAITLESAAGAGAATSGSRWTAMGGGPTRSYSDPTVYPPVTGGSVAASIVDGSLVCYPNPARREPITFAFRLQAAGPVTISVYDASARLVDLIERDGSASDNAITWDPAGRTSGLYVARIEAGGAVVTRPFALIR